MSDPGLDNQPDDGSDSATPEELLTADQPEVEEPKEDADGLGRDVDDPPV